MRGKLETQSSADHGGGRIDGSFLLWRIAIAFAVLVYGNVGYVTALAQSSSAQIEPGVEPGTQVSREWVDPCLGSRWQLKVNPAHPSWPGRVMLVDAGGGGSSIRAPKRWLPKADSANARGTVWAALSTPTDLSPPVIRSGDRVVVDQRSKVMQAHFQAVALETAGVGERLRVRISTSGNAQNTSRGPVISVQATGVGQAQWLSPNETMR